MTMGSEVLGRASVPVAPHGLARRERGGRGRGGTVSVGGEVGGQGLREPLARGEQSCAPTRESGDPKLCGSMYPSTSTSDFAASSRASQRGFVSEPFGSLNHDKWEKPKEDRGQEEHSLRVHHLPRGEGAEGLEERVRAQSREGIHGGGHERGWRGGAPRVVDGGGGPIEVRVLKLRGARAEADARGGHREQQEHTKRRGGWRRAKEHAVRVAVSSLCLHRGFGVGRVVCVVLG